MPWSHILLSFLDHKILAASKRDQERDSKENVIKEIWHNFMLRAGPVAGPKRLYICNIVLSFLRSHYFWQLHWKKGVKNVIIVLNLAQPVSDIIPLKQIARSQNHQLGSYELNKVSLSCVDDKR